MPRILTIGVGGSLDDDLAEFVEVAKAIERGEHPEPYERLNFHDMGALLRTLTPERWRLISYLGAHGPLSIRQTAQGLSRDYKHVHGDVQKLVEIGLVEKTEGGGICVPYQSIVTELKLTPERRVKRARPGKSAGRRAA